MTGSEKKDKVIAESKYMSKEMLAVVAKIEAKKKQEKKDGRR